MLARLKYRNSDVGYVTCLTLSLRAARGGYCHLQQAPPDLFVAYLKVGQKDIYAPAHSLQMPCSSNPSVPRPE